MTAAPRYLRIRILEERLQCGIHKADTERTNGIAILQKEFAV
jgi:hypothetical protein